MSTRFMIHANVFALGVVLLVAWGVARLGMVISFYIGCEGHLVRAASANTVELAAQEMATVVDYLDRTNRNSGYTSIVIRTPNEDVGFWYENLRSASTELRAVMASDTSPLEKSNVLMKLRESITDNGVIIAPEGISAHPYNGAFAWWGGFSIAWCVLTFISYVFPLWRPRPTPYSRGRTIR